jgi:hypothetical protein
MPNIIDITYFQKANDLNLPLSVERAKANPTLQTPNSKTDIENLITRVEKKLLLNAFGLAMYNELQLALADIENPLYASYKKLVQGDEYDDKVWGGLDYDYSLIAYKVWDEFITENDNSLTSIGVVSTNPEKASKISPAYKIANANAKFIEQYQGGYLFYPQVYNDGQFIDWMGCNEGLEVSLYQYLVDKKDEFPLLKIEGFKVYDTKNSFGI